MEAAALAGNQEWLATVAEMIRVLPPGPRAQQISDWAEAMEAILAGQEDGVSKARSVAEAFRNAIQTILAVSTLAAAARHLPADHPERDFLAAQAKEIGAGAGAAGLVDWVDRVVGTAPPSPAGA
jgi:hypothetical protein